MEIIFPIIVGIFIGIVFSFFYFRWKVDSMTRKQGEEIGQRIFEQRKTSLEEVFEEKFKALFEQWKIENEKTVREDALTRSRLVLKGKIAEQLAPLFKFFGHNPSDARFIGDPVDYVIFENYTKVKERVEDEPITIILADVKTGKAELTYEQKRIKEGIEKGLVKFKTIRV
jgi:predicted Holliday junction resolvase-like endonuclease